MKRIIILTAVVLVSAFAVSGQTTCTRHIEASGGFSYCPPPGWSPRDSPSSPYKSFFAPASGTLKANMNVRTEATSITHDAYMGAALRHLLEGNEARGPEARKIVGWTKFTT